MRVRFKAASVWKVAKRVLGLLLIATVSVNVVAFVILNSPPVQRFILERMNARYLSPLGLSAGFRELRLGFFPGALVVSDFALSEAPTVDSQAAKPPSANLVDARGVRVEFDLLTSYASRSLVLSGIVVQGLRIELQLEADGTLRLPAFLRDRVSSGPTDLRAVLHAARAHLPPRLRLEDAIAHVNDPRRTEPTEAVIDSLEIRNGDGREGSRPVEASLSLAPTRIALGPLKRPLFIEDLKFEAAMGDDLVLRVARLDAATSAGSLKASGNARFTAPGGLAGAEAELEAESRFQGAMELFGLRGVGTLATVGSFRYLAGGSGQPTYSGRANWQGLALEDYAIYSGSAAVELRRTRLGVADLDIGTPRGARLQGKGWFELSQEFPFQVDASVRELPFTELMAGLTVPTDVVEFKMDAPDLLVSGHLARDDDKDFDLDFQGPVHVSSLSVPPLHDEERPALPACEVKLALAADGQRLRFDSSRVDCEGGTSVQLPYGRLAYEGVAYRFDLRSDAVNLDALSYFVKSKAAGMASVEGKIAGSEAVPIAFTADVEGTDVELFSLGLGRVRGALRVDKEGVSGTDVESHPVEGSPSRIQLDAFSVAFGKEIRSLFDGHAEGDLAEVAGVARHHLPATLQFTGGKIEKAQVLIQGPLLHPTSWKADTDIRIAEAKSPGYRIRRAEIRLRCEPGDCGQGLLRLDGINRAATESADEGRLVVQIERLSEKAVQLAARGDSVPLSILPFEAGLVDGRLSVDATWSGTQGNWSASGRASVDAFRLSGIDFGPVGAEISAVPGKPIDVLLNARYQQLVARVRVPHHFRGMAEAFVHAEGLHVFSMLPGDLAVRMNLFSSLTAEGNVRFPLAAPQDGRPWLEAVEAQGKLLSLEAQVRQLALQAQNPSDFEMRNGLLEFERVDIASRHGTIRLEGGVHLARSEVEIETRSRLRLSILPEFSPLFGESNGDLETDVNLHGPFSRIVAEGSARIRGGTVGLAQYAPALTELEARMRLADGKLEIQSASAKKGTGKVELAGSVDWSKVTGEAGTALNLSLRFDGAQLRLPAPIVETVESTLSGQLLLTGSKIPYKLEGAVKVDKAQIYRDLVCQDVIAEIVKIEPKPPELGTDPLLQLAVALSSDDTVVVQSGCVRGRFGADLTIAGSEKVPNLQGKLAASGASVDFLKTRFEVESAEFAFDNPVRIDPRLDLRLSSRVQAYRIFVNIDGPLSAYRWNAWSEPSTLPDGEPTTQQDILVMIANGQVPLQSTNKDILNNAASVAISFSGGGGGINESINQTFNRLSGGFIDTVQVQPVVENGQTTFRVKFTKSVAERLNLGVENAATSQAGTVTWSLNDSVNVQGAYNRDTKTGTESELSGGLRFQFGGR